MAGFAFSRRLRQAAMRRGTRGPKVRRSRTRLGALVGDLSRELDRCGFAWRGRLSVSAPSAVLSARRYACRSCPRPSCERVSGEALELANKTLQAPPVEVRRRPAWSSVDGASARMISHNNGPVSRLQFLSDGRTIYLRSDLSSDAPQRATWSAQFARSGAVADRIVPYRTWSDQT
jgi:hypothetical protein